MKKKSIKTNCYGFFVGSLKIPVSVVRFRLFILFMKISEIAQNRVLPSLQKIMSQKLKETDKSGELKLTLCDLAALRAYKDVRDVVEKEGLADIRRQYG